MILILIVILAVAFFAVMIFTRHSHRRMFTVGSIGALLAVCIIFLTLTMTSGFGFETSTKTTTIALASETSVVRNGTGANYTVTVKDPAGTKTTYKNDNNVHYIKLYKGAAAMLQHSSKVRRAKNGFVKFMYQFTGFNNQLLRSQTTISIPKWTTHK